MLIQLNSQDSKDSSWQQEHLTMKISLFYKSHITKACSFVVAFSLIAGTPLMADASFFSNLFGSQAQADEQTSEVLGTVSNSQTLPLLESSVNPDFIKTNDPKNIILVQNDSFISNENTYEDSYVPDVKVEKSSLSDQIEVYTVEEGDTLSGIAETFDISINTIRWENNISGKTISVGQKLNILPMTGVKHIVKSGDTVSKIADKYEADANDILVFNDISKGDGLKQGDIIFVPNGIVKPVVIIKAPSSPSKIVSSNTKAPSGYYLRPVPGPMTSPYGPRHRSFHPGVDLGGVRGTPVMAAADGVVLESVNGCVEGRKSCGGGYGNHIEIAHPNGTTTIYGHLTKSTVSIGQSVSQGDYIGTLGSTGNSTGPHVHFEIRNSSGSTMRPPV